MIIIVAHRISIGELLFSPTNSYCRSCLISATQPLYRPFSAPNIVFASSPPPDLGSVFPLGLHPGHPLILAIPPAPLPIFHVRNTMMLNTNLI